MCSVKAKCHTNLDDFKHEIWPTMFYHPKVGDIVQSRSNKNRCLKIFEIKHSSWTSDGVETPILKIELHK